MTGTINEMNATSDFHVAESKENAARKGGSSCLVQMVQTAMFLLAPLIGYAISYFFQPNYLRGKFSIVDYFTNIEDVLKSPELGITASTVTVVVTFIVWIATLILGIISRSK